MRLARWQPLHAGWEPFQQLQSEMNRLFDRWTAAPEAALGDPAVNVWEEGEVAVLEAELPGVEFKDLEVYVTGGNHLTLKGTRKPLVPDKGVWHRQERGVGTFTRSLTLPFVVDAEKVEAKLDNGVLQVRLPKHESAKPRKIVVKAE